MAVFTLLLTACTPEEATPPSLGRHIAAHIGGLAWDRDGSLFALYWYGSEEDPSLAQFTSDGDLRPVELDPSGFCGQPGFVDLATLPDGTVGAVVTCENTEDGTEERVAVRIEGRKLVRLASLGAPNRLIRWNRDMRTGWLELRTGRCHSLGFFQDGESLSFPAYEPADVLAWDLRAASLEGAHCLKPGRAGFADVGSEGNLYFLASDRAVGRYEVPDATWRPLVFDPGSGRLRTFGPEFVDPFDMAVVPNARSVLVTGARDGRRGVWQVSVDSGKAELLASGDYRAVVGALDGRRMAVVHAVGGKEEVLELEVARGE